MIFSQQELLRWIFVYKYFILFPVVVVEGPVVTLIAGMYISTGHLDGFVSYIVLTAGDLVGDSLYYAIGRKGSGRLFPVKWCKILGVTKDQITKFKSFFQNHKTKTLLVGKWSHAVGVPILLAAGLAKVPYGQFLTISIFATLPKTLVLLGLGYYFSKSYAKIATYLGYTTTGIVAVFLMTAIYIGVRMVHTKFLNRN